MAEAFPERDLFERFRATIGVFVTLAGATCGMTLLYLAMRAVMEIGGFCAEGGAFVIEHHCPKGSTGLIFGGIWGGLIFFGLYAWQVSKHHVPSFLGLGWSALFLSLGWNFLEFGLNPPGPGDGLAWGWLICAIVFGLMGGLPLLAVVKPIFRGFFREEQPGTVGGILSGAFGATASMVRQVARPSSTATVSTTSAPYSPPRAPGSSAADIAEALERIDALHRSGSLTDEEFEAAKLQVLTED